MFVSAVLCTINRNLRQVLRHCISYSIRKELMKSWLSSLGSVSTQSLTDQVLACKIWKAWWWDWVINMLQTSLLDVVLDHRYIWWIKCLKTNLDERLYQMFFCIQIPELLKNGFLGGKPSAAKILMELELFSKVSFHCHSVCILWMSMMAMLLCLHIQEDFETEAIKRFRGNPEGFYDDLTWVFHQVSESKAKYYHILHCVIA